MITLTLQNSYSHIGGLNKTQESSLRKVLSYRLPAQSTYYTHHHNPIRYLIDRRGNFPDGLRFLVLEWLDVHNLVYIIKDQRIKPPSPFPRIKRNLKLGVTPYPDQIDAVEACLNANGTVSMPTGTGKSITMALLVQALGVPTLIIVPTLHLKRQLTDDFTRYFGQLREITIENVDSPALKKAGNYQALIIDEAHGVAAKTYQLYNRKYWNSIFYRFFFTATPFRSQDHEMLLMQSLAGKVIYKLSYKDAVDKGYIVPVEAYYVEAPKKETSANTWAQVYSELVVNNEPRNAIIRQLMYNLTAADKSTLVLVKEIKHGENLYGANGGWAYGENEHTASLLEAFNDRTKGLLVGTTGILGEGIDSRPCEFVIIAGSGKSKNQFMQNIGRAVRRYPGKESAKVILIKDYSHKFLINHFKACTKYLLEEYGIKPVKLEV